MYWMCFHPFSGSTYIGQILTDLLWGLGFGEGGIRCEGLVYVRAIHWVYLVLVGMISLNIYMDCPEWELKGIKW